MESLEARIAPTVVTEAEPNNSAAAGNVVAIPTGDVTTANPADWLTIEGAISSFADRDCFRFTLNSASGVFFDFDSRDIGLSSTLDAVLDIYDSTGMTLLGQSDDGYDFGGFAQPLASSSAANSPDPSFYLDLGPGTYVARLSSFSQLSVGAYEFRMLADENASAAPPVFESLPGAPVQLYLDFDGATDSIDWGSYAVAGFDLSGNVNTFTPAERLAIQHMWRIVAEDFSPFDINVTTLAPSNLDNGVAYRVVVSSNSGTSIGYPSFALSAAQIGGFAGVGSNTGFVFQPPFSDYQGGISGRVVAATLAQGNIVSQTFGTALGLKHYSGVPDLPNAIMRVPDLGLRFANWSAGNTSAAEPPVVAQNDVQVITSPANGITIRADDFGDTIPTSGDLTGATTSGLLNSVTDRDVFLYPGVRGNLDLQVSSNTYSGNVNPELRVFNSSGELLGTGVAADAFHTSLNVYLPETDSYFIDVRSSGSPGAIGQYSLDLSLAPATGPTKILTTFINGGDAQRSNVTDIIVRFSRPVFFPDGVLSAFFVSGSALAPPLDVDLSNSTPSQSIAIVRFSDGMGGFQSVPDGTFTFTVDAVHVQDDQDVPLDGDGDGTAGGDFVLPFFRIFGDATGNGVVDLSDFALFRGAYGVNMPNPAYHITFDFNLDGTIDLSDFSQFRAHFGMTP